MPGRRVALHRMLRTVARLVNPRGMRGALILVLFATTSVAAAPAAPDAARAGSGSAAPAAPAVPAGPDDAKAVAILERIVAGPDSGARKAAIAELTQIAPRAVEG